MAVMRGAAGTAARCDTYRIRYVAVTSEAYPHAGPLPFVIVDACPGAGPGVVVARRPERPQDGWVQQYGSGGMPVLSKPRHMVAGPGLYTSLP
jgi:hypothetical protein